MMKKALAIVSTITGFITVGWLIGAFSVLISDNADKATTAGLCFFFMVLFGLLFSITFKYYRIEKKTVAIKTRNKKIAKQNYKNDNRTCPTCGMALTSNDNKCQYCGTICR